MTTPRPKPIEEGSAPRVLGSPWLEGAPADAEPAAPAMPADVGQLDPMNFDAYPLDDLGRQPWRH